DRLDIQFSLAEAAEIVSKPQVAMKAYALILANDHRSYYAEIARPYLAHLLRYGRRALLEDRPRDAIPFYEQITLIEDEKGNDPVDLETFSRRLARRLNQSRLEVMLDIFQYARRRDQIFLAKAAIEEAL